MKKLSIIIPMYNAEKYIANCLDSILSSNLPKGEYEILIVNDGSTDDGPTIAQSYVENNSNISYLTQENQGQSAARNLGIKQCHGEYVWCVDADDMVYQDIVELFKQLSNLKALDILAFCLRVENEDGLFVRPECSQPSLQHDKLMSGREAIIGGYDPSSVCALWIRKQFILENNLFFKVGITHQDVELSYRLFASAHLVMFTSFSPYRYILHPNSTSQSINPAKKIKYLSDDIVVYLSFKNLAQSTQMDQELSSVIANRAQNILFSLVFSLYRKRKIWSPLGVNRAVVDKLKENHLYPIKGPFDSWKKRVASWWLNIEANLL